MPQQHKQQQQKETTSALPLWQRTRDANEFLESSTVEILLQRIWNWFLGASKKPQRKVNRNRSQLAIFVSAFKSIIRLQTRPATTCFAQHRNRQMWTDMCVPRYTLPLHAFTPVYPACEEMPNNDHDKNQTGTSLIKAAIKKHTHTHTYIAVYILAYVYIELYKFTEGQTKVQQKTKNDN